MTHDPQQLCAEDVREMAAYPEVVVTCIMEEGVVIDWSTNGYQMQLEAQRQRDLGYPVGLMVLTYVEPAEVEDASALLDGDDAGKLAP